MYELNSDLIRLEWRLSLTQIIRREEDQITSDCMHRENWKQERKLFLLQYVKYKELVIVRLLVQTDAGVSLRKLALRANYVHLVKIQRAAIYRQNSRLRARGVGETRRLSPLSTRIIWGDQITRRIGALLIWNWRTGRDGHIYVHCLVGVSCPGTVQYAKCHMFPVWSYAIIRNKLHFHDRNSTGQLKISTTLNQFSFFAPKNVFNWAI